ncbi:hypothetical protein, conserved [Babesia ovata]|uniref:Uncharacterized protein n=1 Tax=Babesia ovata TaxID=189622 RepID=A0A2H6KC09_9APIC|nr:uncharacterized protein BOVATA_020180 [Babesia ovata]GBE60525.1 hypothetical protein, conserved [Babesia ovata]
MHNVRLVLLLFAIVFGSGDAGALNARVFASVRSSYTGNDAARVPHIRSNHIAFAIPGLSQRLNSSASCGVCCTTSLQDVTCPEGVGQTDESRRVGNRITIRRHCLHAAHSSHQDKTTNEARKRKSRSIKRSGRKRTLVEVSKEENVPSEGRIGAKNVKSVDIKGNDDIKDVVSRVKKNLKVAKGKDAVGVASASRGDTTSSKKNTRDRLSTDKLTTSQIHLIDFNTTGETDAVESEWSYDREVEPIDVAPEVPELSPITQDDSKSEEGGASAISNRRLHVLHALFSDEHRINARDIVSVLYHQLGSPNVDLINLYRNIESEGGNSYNEHLKSSNANEDTDAEGSEQHAYSGRGDSSAVSQNYDSNNVTPLDISPDSGYIKPLLESESVVRVTVEQNHGEEATDDGREHKNRNTLHATTVSLTPSELRTLKHINASANHEKLNLLRSMGRHKRISAIFLPVGGNTHDSQHDNAGDHQNQGDTSGINIGFGSSNKPFNGMHSELNNEKPPKEEADRAVANRKSTKTLDTGVDSNFKTELDDTLYVDAYDSLGNKSLGYTVNDTEESYMPIVNTAFGSMDTPASAEVSSNFQNVSGKEYTFYRSTDDLSANLTSDYHHSFDSLLLSVPTKTRKLHKKTGGDQIETDKGGVAEGQNAILEHETIPDITSTGDDSVLSIPGNSCKNTEQTKEQDASGFSIPVNMFTLRRGFLASLYKTYLRPSLISTLESVFKTKIEEPCGAMDFITLGVDAEKLIGKARRFVNDFAWQTSDDRGDGFLPGSR